jgi:hypothetical protein
MILQRLLIAITAAFIGSATCAIAQMRFDAPSLPSLVDVGYGVYVTLDRVTHTPEFHQLDGISSCCPNQTYPENTSSGLHAGFL